MIVFSLFLALALERLRVTPAGWELDEKARSFDAWLTGHRTFGSARQNTTFGPFLLLIPAFILAILLLMSDQSLLLLLVNVLVLTLVIGCRNKRDAMREWFLAVQREDLASQKEQAEKFLGDGAGPGASIGDHILWLNFRFYFAVALWFVLLGAPGALAYAFFRANADRVGAFMDWIDWIPSRVASFAFLLVGNFSKALPVWLEHLTKVEASQETLLTIARSAEEIPSGDVAVNAEPEAMLALARRSTILLLAAIALATLFGWVV
ncbi:MULTISPECIES: regulatory signaling modulator protein AmpE [Gammaproteobacteria]|uniref:regulatory signaling modulator protein AmpE n=1 Tax=Gammaproteobacteria TaxID=1236 RepID=UPI000DCF748F|nr:MULTISPECIES: regulatory signaling modulator protein AmpE [Gammaproteobacteria]RTE86301.1 regulatory signaling modulator protein AmpE [Aliidiomarina sp. B3213]TCZ91652.1 regulatory signaling modulator protein AmpE [Lysobacter sp. N42]